MTKLTLAKSGTRQSLYIQVSCIALALMREHPVYESRGSWFRSGRQSERQRAKGKEVKEGNLGFPLWRTPSRGCGRFVPAWLHRRGSFPLWRTPEKQFSRISYSTKLFFKA
jgi:hypothetical protein